MSKKEYPDFDAKDYNYSLEHIRNGSLFRGTKREDVEVGHSFFERLVSDNSLRFEVLPFYFNLYIKEGLKMGAKVKNLDLFDWLVTLDTKEASQFYNEGGVGPMGVYEKIDIKVRGEERRYNNDQIALVRWCLDNDIKVGGMYPLAFAIQNNAEVGATNPVLYALKGGLKIDGKDPLVYLKKHKDKKHIRRLIIDAYDKKFAGDVDKLKKI